MLINPELINLAKYRLGVVEGLEKQSFVPPGSDPASQQQQAGAGQGGPGMGGPTPPPGMDPSAMGGAGGPPSDPSAMGGAGGGDSSALTPDLIKQMIRQEMMTQPATTGTGGAGGAKGPGTMKPDMNALVRDNYQMKKILVTIAQHLQIPVEEALLAEPNRDPQTGEAIPPPQANPQAAPTQPAQTSSIQPIQPMQPASLSPPSTPQEAPAKMAHDLVTPIGDAYPYKIAEVVANKANAMSAIIRAVQARKK